MQLASGCGDSYIGRTEKTLDGKQNKQYSFSIVRALWSIKTHHGISLQVKQHTRLILYNLFHV